MASKQEILQRIQGLLLVTEENREKLKSFVESADDEALLHEIELLIDEEDKVIETTVQEIAEAGLKNGDKSIITLIDDALSHAKEKVKHATKEVEKEEKQNEEDEAQSLLSNFS